MRCLYLYCHPLEDSFHGALHRRGLAALARAGHEVDDLDLYREGFDPVLSAEGRRDYHDERVNQQGLEGYIARLRQAEALIVQFPTWSFGPPAMLKGFFDRVFLPGVAFDLSDPARVRPLFGQIRCLIGISTYGRSRGRAWLVGDPPRKLVTRYLRWFVARRARVRYLALYHMNIASEAQRTAFLDRVERELARL
jgi:putative NADPH-quinone reductase